MVVVAGAAAVVIKVMVGAVLAVLLAVPKQMPYMLHDPVSVAGSMDMSILHGNDIADMLLLAYGELAQSLRQLGMCGTVAMGQKRLGLCPVSFCRLASKPSCHAWYQDWPSLADMTHMNLQCEIEGKQV